MASLIKDDFYSSRKLVSLPVARLNPVRLQAHTGITSILALSTVSALTILYKISPSKRFDATLTVPSPFTSRFISALNYW